MAFDPQGRGGAAGNDDLYEVLGLTLDATDADVDAAYQRLLNGLTGTGANSPAAAENLRRRRIRLANAYAVLADPAGRAAYDARMGLHAAAPPAPPDIVIPATPIPPMAMPEVIPRTETPPMRMPEVIPRTAVPPMRMPEIRTPAPVRPQRPALAPPPTPEPPPAAPSAAVTEPATPAPAEAGGVGPLPVEPALERTVAGSLPFAPLTEELAPAADPLFGAEAAPVAEATAGITASRAAEESPGDDLAETAPPLDDTPAPWEPPTRRTPAAPSVKARPPERRSAPPPRPVGGVVLPSRKVAEATPLPAPRSRVASTGVPTQPLSNEEAENPPPRPRPAPRATPAPARQRAPAPARRTSSRKNRTNTWQTIFYAGMALILAIGTIAGIVTSVGVGTTGSPAATPVVSNSAALTQAAALLAAGNYTQAISLYNQVLTNSNGTDAKALLGLAKAYYYKTPSEPDIAREYLARVFTSTGGSTSSPESQEALTLLSTIGLPGSPAAETPGTPAANGTAVPATAGATAPTPLPPTVDSSKSDALPTPTLASGTTPLPPTTSSGATRTTPLPATQPLAPTIAAAPPAGAPAAGTAPPNP